METTNWTEDESRSEEKKGITTQVFEQHESNVRSYCRSFPEVFTRAKGALMYVDSGKAYIDFFCGAGALNYGHNNDFIKKRVTDYLASDGVMHALDMHTQAKGEFLAKFVGEILKPRGLDYKVQFCGPTGANAVEAALKLARMNRQCPGIFAFMGSFHGMSLGSLSVTGSRFHRSGAGVPLDHVTFLPFPYGSMAKFDTIEYIESILDDPNSGIEKPAAVIVETIQAEGGVIVAPVEWLQRLRELCSVHGILLICDEVQVGCHRTGPFFSFERAKIVPDMVVLSKSISGYGLPMSLVLMKPELDIWQPGQHSGSFRGNQLAFVAATAAIDFIKQAGVEQQVKEKEKFLADFLNREILSKRKKIKIRGMGMIWGIDVSDAGGPAYAKKVADRCFKHGLIIELVGRNDTVLKILPPLTIETDILVQGCSIIRQALEE